jgi:hypothetical protein
MEFRLEYHPPSSSIKIDINDKLLLIGSCFTEHIHSQLKKYKFSTLQNPHGTLFNPFSIFKAIESYIKLNLPTEDDLFFQHGLWNSWDFHSSISHEDKFNALTGMIHQIKNGHDFLKTSDVLFITLGSAFVYELENKTIVANCHKVPSSVFYKRLLEPAEIINGFRSLLSILTSFNKNIKVIFTISPVRHLRDGFIENNRSKAVLIHAVDKIVQEFPLSSYFPSYELVIDDLRDYRFFAEDMVHPNYLATKYVWDKFCSSFINGRTRELMKEIEQLHQAFIHRPMHPHSDEHQQFKLKFKELAIALSNRFPELDFKQEIKHFG